MDTPHAEPASRIFTPEHFASDYERYAALLMTRAHRIGHAALRLYADGERCELLALPPRDANAPKYRLSQDEIAALAPMLAEREHELARTDAWRAPVFRNIDTLAERLNLTPCERQLLALAVITQSQRVLRNAMESLAPHLRDRPALAHGLAALLNLDGGEVMRALHADNTLIRAALVHIDLQDEDNPPLRPRDGLTAILLDEFDTGDALFARFVKPARAAGLATADFAHLEADVALLTGLLRNAAATRETGINIMLYGAPGTGKTELARLLASSAGLSLQEVPHSHDDGEDMTRARYSQVIVAQRLLQSASGVALLFDETEDLLPPEDADTGRTLGKAAFNHLLESNAVPMIWISNKINQIDPAYLRRFACVLEVKKPNRAVRRRIAERAFNTLAMNDAFLTRIANIEEASPGQITQAARVAKLLASETCAAQSAERVLAHGMRALRQRPAAPREHATRFDAGYLNCGMDVHTLVHKLTQKPRGRLVFHGPPGTGKSALARHIAEAANCPLLIKRASDLLSKWVGEAEQNIALAFEQATDEGAVLLLDEADSLLSDRRDAHARWELSETNELLTQMEQFNGLFICTTNLMERLDRAALRRFTLKLRFDYLQPQQIRTLLTETLHALGCATAGHEALETAARFNSVTPGDIASVLERFRLLEEQPHAGEFVSALREELALKQEGSVQRMGF